MRVAWIVCALFVIGACSAGSDGSGKGKGSGTGGGAAANGSAASGGLGAGALSSGSAGLGGNSTGTAGGAGARSSTNPTGQGDSCSPVGMTRACCGAGNQTCQGTGEFPLWGPCIGSNGLTMTTCTIPGGCGVGEFGPNCDRGVDAGHGCGAGEFGPGCDAGVPTLPPAPKLCTDPTVSTEPKIIAGYSPTAGQTVGSNGQIKVWITDECPAFVATGEMVDATTGQITVAGDRTAKAIDNYLLEPALYIAPMSADTGGTPHFPQWVKGDYNNAPNALGCYLGSSGTKGPAVDPAPPGSAPLDQFFNTEFIWDVNALGLGPGTYLAQFLIHDGDFERAVGCIAITITGSN